MLPPGGSNTATVSYNPTTVGNHASILQVNSNAPNQNEINVPIQGQGVAGAAAGPEQIPTLASLGILVLVMGLLILSGFLIGSRSRGAG